jgi:hypothetical protein
MNDARRGSPLWPCRYWFWEAQNPLSSPRDNPHDKCRHCHECKAHALQVVERVSGTLG